MESKQSKVVLIEPEEWKNNHIEAHKLLNRAVASFVNQIDSLSKNIQDTEHNAGEKYASAFSEIKELKKEIKKINETLGSTDGKITELKEECNKWGKYLVRNYEWIIDTDSQTVVELEEIVLDWNYLVNIVPCEVIPNSWTEIYSLPQTSIATGSYTPKAYLMAKQWEHAVLEYDFNVILTQI